MHALWLHSFGQPLGPAAPLTFSFSYAWRPTRISLVGRQQEFLTPCERFSHSPRIDLDPTTDFSCCPAATVLQFLRGFVSLHLEARHGDVVPFQDDLYHYYYHYEEDYRRFRRGQKLAARVTKFPTHRLKRIRRWVSSFKPSSRRKKRWQSRTRGFSRKILSR